MAMRSVIGLRDNEQGVGRFAVPLKVVLGLSRSCLFHLAVFKSQRYCVAFVEVGDRYKFKLAFRIAKDEESLGNLDS